MDQIRLFDLAPVAVHLSAVHEPGRGWHLRIMVRAQGDPWNDAEAVHYDCLSSPELADVIDAEVRRGLALI